MNFAKSLKGSRFKRFTSRQDAQAFSELDVELNRPAMETDNAEAGASDPSGEPVSCFKGPKTQELTVLRKAIERGDADAFTSLVWSNPRYLIGPSGYTPVILQEGFRYNALHVAAKAQQPAMARLIVDTIEDARLYRLLYDDDDDDRGTDDVTARRMNLLVDLYLNMPDKPDKGFCETPLHFACKFGAKEIVEILASHPATDRGLRNKFNQTPADIICQRVSNPSSALVNEIMECLQDKYYVSVLRSDDNEVLPIISEPWSPARQCDHRSADDTRHTPTSLLHGRRQSQQRSSPISPSMSVRACAGPMSATKAEELHQAWKFPLVLSPTRAYSSAKIRRADNDKGLERIGRRLSHEMAVPWREYWSAFDDYADLSTQPGLAKLEQFLRKRFGEVAAAELEKKQEEEAVWAEACEFHQQVESPTMQDLARHFDTLSLNSPRRAEDARQAADHAESSPRCDSPSVGIDLPSSVGGRYDRAPSVSSDDESDVYVTPPQSPRAGESLPPPPPPPPDIAAYIGGSEPSKVDVDVMRALEDVEVDPRFYPHTARWRRLVMEFPERERERWRSPAAPRYRHRTTALPASSLATPPTVGRSPVMAQPRLAATPGCDTDAAAAASTSPVSSTTGGSTKPVPVNLFTKFQDAA
ncbi:PREDICTED: ankyrin repeat and LEM domain-containing protein 2-like [Priapulus caudatus]|uniref:Ankyrin repeat and LEM domain-containing protein 2-like n=1 Tax=Priapulus caudatus TaxID=37621 RepID=A0ABM1EXB6_PRICU|nr:PREDICTED: ankyrin repeat and LEM domain-containing protein 2-like [Priapulus caudatus]